MKKFEEFLSPQEKAKVRQFIKDEKMMAVVKKVLLAGIYENGVLKKEEEAPSYTKNFALGLVLSQNEFTNEQIGAVLRAQAEGIRALELGFIHLEGMKEEKPKEEKKENPAR